MRPSRAVWLAASIAAAACGGDGPARALPVVSWEGEHLRVATDVEAPLCGGTAPYMDRLLGALGEQLGTPLSHRPIYYLLDGEIAEYDTPCEADAYGCSDGAAAYARIAPMDHEIVHLARSAIGFSYPLIEEGAAEYWGDDADIRGPLRGDVLDIASRGSEFPFELYPRAGHFVAYLIDDRGEEAFGELSMRTSFQSSLAEFREAVVGVYGEELEALVEDYEVSYPECLQNEYRAALGDCAFAPALPLCDESGATLRIQRQFSCGDEDVLGPRFGRLWTTIPVEIPVGGIVGLRFTASSEIDVQLKLRRCGGGCGRASLGPFGPSETLRSQSFEAGRHVIEIEWAEGEEVDVEVELFGPCG